MKVFLGTKWEWNVYTILERLFCTLSLVQLSLPWPRFTTIDTIQSSLCTFKNVLNKIFGLFAAVSAFFQRTMLMI